VVEHEAIALQQNQEQQTAFGLRLKLYQSNIPYLDHGVLALDTSALLVLGKFAEAEPLARECLELRQIIMPDDWRTFNARSMLGGCLLGQKKYTEAEPLLLSGYEGLKQRKDKIPTAGSMRPQQALERLVQLYDETGRPELAAESKKELVELEKTQK
jgi:eukaryotic-like serine/threonine-protein kinase